MPPRFERNSLRQKKNEKRVLVGRGARGAIVSIFFHCVLLILLTFLTFPALRDFSLSLELGDAILQENATLDAMVTPEAAVTAAPRAISLPTESLAPQIPEMSEMTVETPTEFTVDSSDFQLSMMSSSSLLSAITTPLGGRKQRSMLVVTQGGNEASERAVTAALEWFARHQLPSGAWSYQHTASPQCRESECPNPTDKPEIFASAYCSATAMALLPFLGAGHTHREGDYQKVVRDGLNYLKRQAIPTPEGACFYEPNAASHGMYHQGIVTIALCEAAAMTGDKELTTLSQRAIDFIVAAQDPRGGGWRYAPRTPGDTSVLGWCVMALKSGEMANLNVPPNVFVNVTSFLDRSVTIDDGARYQYRTTYDLAKDHYGDDRSTTAIGLLSRLYMGWRYDNPLVERGADYLLKLAPQEESSVSAPLENLYYCYYATQLMHHIGGERWEEWNRRVRDPLVAMQETRGHSRGSWYVAGGLVHHGGRHAATSLATMILEVYYRHLPLYQTNKDAIFPLD